jgi:hypothetical protein
VGSYNVTVRGQDVPGNTLIQLTNLPQRNDFKYTLSLTPDLVGTMPVSGVVTLTALLKRHDAITLTTVPITFTVTDENGIAEPAVARTPTSEGLAVFTYTRTITKSDKVLAKAVVDGIEVYSEQAEVFWFEPVHKVSITPVTGRFFTSNADNIFTTQPGATPLFTQTFPLINFNPNGYPCPRGSDNPPSSQADFCTLPLTDVLVDPISGLPNDYLPVQGNGYVLGKGVFQGGGGLGATGFRGDGVLTGNLVFKESGRVVLHIVSDGSFYLGIGNGVTRATDARPLAEYFDSGRTVVYNSVFYNYPLVAANSWAAYWGVITVPLMIPNPGVYPFELDYTDGGGPAGLYIRDESGSIAARPVGSIKLVSLNPASQEIGVTQVHTLTAEVKDNANQPVNGLVTLLIERAGSPQYLTQQATNGTTVFTYTGSVPGSEQLQAFAWIRGQRMPSNILMKDWTSPPNPPVNNPERPDIGCALNYRWVNQPAMQANLSGRTQVSLANGVALPISTVVQIYPTSEPTYAAMITLTTITTAIGTTDGREIPGAIIDPTKLANGGYILRLAYLDAAAANKCQSNLTLFNVVGENKPGRVAFDVTDFTVPVAGMPIVVGRTYDSLERGTKGDFGHGWNLSISSPKLEVNPAGDVTLTLLDGRRVTFFFTPGSSLFGFGPVGYTAEAGVYGSLTARDCSAVASAGGAGGYVCFPGGRYDPDGYTYRDPYGRIYNIERSAKTEPFKLTSLTDLTGNTLKFADDGIRASNLTGNVNGGNKIVSFERDSENASRKLPTRRARRTTIITLLPPAVMQRLAT